MKFQNSLVFRNLQRVNFIGIVVSYCRTLSSAATDCFSADALKRAKPFLDIPGPKTLPLFGVIHRYLPIIGDYSKNKWHETQKLKFEQYGSIVREEIVPGFHMVNLYDPKDIEIVSRNEGKYPRRDFFTSTKMLRESRPDFFSTAGVGPANGKDWYDIRRRFQKPMLRPDIMRTYLPHMNVIADDLIQRIRCLRQPDQHVPNLIEELFKWALESVNYIMFNERMGCLDDNNSPDSLSQQYIRGVKQFFQLTAKVELSSFPIWRAYPALSPSFRKLKRVHDFLFDHAMGYVKKKMGGARQEVDDPTQLSLIEMLLQNGSPSDASVMAVDALAAGIDTTSLTTAYILRNLAANPRVQRKLQKEVDRNAPRGTSLTVEAVENIPYLRACVKEAMRLNPVLIGTSRTLDTDVVVSGYRVPANTFFLLNYNVSSVQESNFPNAQEYVPERWLKDESGNAPSSESFAFVPFGFGARMCLGRRIAELEMFTLITKLMQNFWVEDKSPSDLQTRFQLVLMITSPLKYEFYERYKS